MKRPEEFSVSTLLVEFFDSGSISVEQLNHLVRQLRTAAQEGDTYLNALADIADIVEADFGENTSDAINKTVEAVKSLRAQLKAAQQSPVTATDERTNEFGEPETVYLQLHDPDDGNEKSHGSNYKADGVTWCWHPINENDVRYIRADLFQQSPEVAVPDDHMHVSEFIDLCKSFSSRAGSIYIGDVESALSGILSADRTLQSPRITEQDAREIINSFNHWFAKPNLRVPGIIRNHDSEVFPVFMDEEVRALLEKLNNR